MLDSEPSATESERVIAHVGHIDPSDSSSPMCGAPVSEIESWLATHPDPLHISAKIISCLSMEAQANEPFLFRFTYSLLQLR
jgi:hypothetical protein